VPTGQWSDEKTARPLYNELRSLDGSAVTISLCQQIVARPALEVRLLLLAIKLGIEGSEDDLIAVLFVYGDKTMAEDYLNSGSTVLAEGAAKWAMANHYRISRGPGSSRSAWGRF
jgi:hypothetical protein